MLMEGAVLWITLSPVSERQVVMALRKGMQHNLGGGGNHSSSGNVGSSGGGVHAMMGNHTTSSSSSGTSGGGGGITGRIHVVSVPLEVADGVLQQHEDEDDNNNHHSEDNKEEQQQQQSFSHERYLKQLHQRIVHWLKHRELLSPSQYEQQASKQNNQTGNSSSSTTTTPLSIGPNLIIIDNGTMLSTMFGDTLSNAFLSSVRATMRNYSQTSSSHTTTITTTTSTSTTTTTTRTAVVNTTNLLTIRITSPDDGGLYQPNDEDNVMKGEKLRSEYSRLLRPWLGMGSGYVDSSVATTTTETTMNITQLEEQCNYLSLATNATVPSMVYRCGLYELADAIVDVSPLESGYARDVLGRLSFATTWSGKGWWGVSSIGGGGAAVAAVAAGVNSGGRSSNTNKDDSNRAYSSICVNYRCDDSGVRVMRLRSR